VAKVVDDSLMIRESILPSFKIAAENRHSWRLRFAVAEYAANLSSYISKIAVDDEIVGFYELLLRDGEPEVRSEAIAKIP
jgi:serine/threonine-protein phosphatase 2A regulatory subunit A